MAKTWVLIAALALARPGIARDNDLERWYMLWGVGMASNHYTELLQSQLHEEGLDFRSRSPADLRGVAFDALGFYWPLGKKTLIGGLINGSHDVFHRQGEHCISLLNYLYSVSTLHFWADAIGQGPFARADIGFTRFGLNHGGGCAVSLDRESILGLGFLLGGGYGIRVVQGTRLLLNANFSLRQAGVEQTTSIGLTLSGLF